MVIQKKSLKIIRVSLKRLFTIRSFNKLSRRKEGKNELLDIKNQTNGLRKI